MAGLQERVDVRVNSAKHHEHEASGTACAGFSADQRESRESTRICPAAASRLVAGGAIRDDSPDSRRFVFPTKNARIPVERDQTSASAHRIEAGG